MAIREGAWDCPSCGQKGNPGSAKHCGGCGAVRGEGIEFYLPEGAREVSSDEEMRRANAGPDWKCPYCGGDNPGSNSHCSGCGSAASGDKRQTKTMLDHQPKPAEPAGPNWMSRIALGCCGLLLLFFVGCWVLTRTSVKTLKVDSMSWQRSIDIEALSPVTEEGWQDKGEVPSGARILSRNREVREHRQIQTGTQSKTRTVNEQVQTGTKKVKVGSKDMGNGYFEDVYEDQPVYENKQREERYEEPQYRSEPVYDTKVRYEIEKWHKESSAEEHGADNKPRWPAVDSNAKRRQGQRHESYKVNLSGEGKSYIFETAKEADFTPLSPGLSVDASVSVLGVVSDVHPK